RLCVSVRPGLGMCVCLCVRVSVRARLCVSVRPGLGMCVCLCARACVCYLCIARSLFGLTVHIHSKLSETPNNITVNNQLALALSSLNISTKRLYVFLWTTDSAGPARTPGS